VTDIQNNDKKTTALAEQAILTFSVISIFFTLGWVLWYCHYGIDFTDESFYLVWISNPFNYSISTTQFGFIYHPLYQVLNGNIVALRQSNILITFFLAWVLSNIFLKSVYGGQALSSMHRLIISGGIATASLVSLVFKEWWLPTPSYNTLALQALLVAAIGLLLADKKISRVSVAGWALIGIGVWLAFMAKPTTAAALSLCSALYLLVAGKFSFLFLVISLATALGVLVLSALSIDGSVIAFIDRLKGGLELANTLESNRTLAQLLRLDDFHLSGRARFILIVTTAVIFSSAYLSQAKIKAMAYGGTILSIIFALASSAIVFGVTHKTLNVGPFQGLLLWSIPFAAILVGFALCRFKGLLQISRLQWALALSFLLFPYAYAFGTGNNYWASSSGAAIFWVLAGLVLLSPIAPNLKFPALLLPFGLAVQLVTVALVQTGIEAPYRQPQPLRENNYEIEIGRPGSKLMLSKDFGLYFSEAVDLAKRAQFIEGTPMIDLSGQSPGILYAIGASSIGAPWILGGYPDSDKFAVEALKRVPCEELSVAWLLTEPESSRKISPEILSSYGADLAKDFEIVGMFMTAEGAAGHKEARLQQFLKPVRSIHIAMTACAAARAITK
jgi:hypothetical protein